MTLSFVGGTKKVDINLVYMYLILLQLGMLGIACKPPEAN